MSGIVIRVEDPARPLPGGRDRRERRTRAARLVGALHAQGRLIRAVTHEPILRDGRLAADRRAGTTAA